MVRLYIIRHGDPDYDTNKEQGGSLTENGKAEASALATFMAAEGITHAYSSPLGRARLTAELALANIPKFSHRFYGEKEKEKGDPLHPTGGQTGEMKQSDEKSNFELNVGIEDWSRELNSWRQSSHLDEHCVKLHSKNKKKPPAIWDFPAPIIRTQLQQMNEGETSSKGWKDSCPDYRVYDEEYKKFCNDADEFLSRHGILKTKGSPNYHLAKHVASSPEKRQQKIALFCHGGMGLTYLSHLLSIPLPMVHASMWLPPSSVTTILFDEHQNLDGQVIVTPRAIQIGGTNHLAAAGLKISNSFYEDDGKRPAGIKHNFW